MKGGCAGCGGKCGAKAKRKPSKRKGGFVPASFFKNSNPSVGLVRDFAMKAGRDYAIPFGKRLAVMP